MKRTSWNKGLTKETDERVKNYSEKLKGPRPQISEENNPFYGRHHTKESKEKIIQHHLKNGGGLNWWAKQLKKKYKRCVLCKSSRSLDMHHKDHNRDNNERSNFIVICRTCHKFWHMYDKWYWRRI